jgi:hypothetical protein
MKAVFIAGPFRGANAWEVERNIRRAEELAFAVAEAGAMPLCPHTNTRFFDGTLTDEFWLEGTMEMMRRCDAVMMVDGWRRSTGATTEHDEAVRARLPVFESISMLDLWLRRPDEQWLTLRSPSDS